MSGKNAVQSIFFLILLRTVRAKTAMFSSFTKNELFSVQKKLFDILPWERHVIYIFCLYCPSISNRQMVVYIFILLDPRVFRSVSPLESENPGHIPEGCHKIRAGRKTGIVRFFSSIFMEERLYLYGSWRGERDHVDNTHRPWKKN